MASRSVIVVPTRLVRSALVACLAIVAAACGFGPFAPGWHGTDVHQVGDTWVGKETPCAADDADCRRVLDRALSALVPELRNEVVSAVLAELPDTYVTPTGESRRAPMMRGLDRRTALIVDLANGERRVLGLWCYLPRNADGSIEADAASCSTGDLGYWRNGNMPPPNGL